MCVSNDPVRSKVAVFAEDKNRMLMPAKTFAGDDGFDATVAAERRRKRDAALVVANIVVVEWIVHR